MKKIYFGLFLLMGLYSCSDNNIVDTDEDESSDYLTIGNVLTADVSSSTTRAAGLPFLSSASNTGWAVGDRMGIWCINTELAQFKIHSDLACSNTIATYTSAGWDIDGERRRLNSPYLAAMYAYYPYVANYVNTNKEVTVDSIPITMTDQYDVIYGSNLHDSNAELSRAMNIAYDSDLINDDTEGILSNKVMKANLYMHHATALIEFRIRRRSFSGLGHVDKAIMSDEENKFIDNGILTAWFDYSNTERYRTADGSDIATDVKNLPNTKKLPQFEERLRDDKGVYTDEYTPIDLGRIKAVDYVSELTSKTPNLTLPSDTVSRISVYFFVAPQSTMKPKLKMYFDSEENPFEFQFDKAIEPKAGYRYVYYGRVDGGNYIYFGEPQIAKWDDEVDITPNKSDEDDENNLHLQY